MNISTTDAQGLYTNKLIATYQEKTIPRKFLASFFKPEETTTLEISIEVERNNELIAVDVLRGSDGNRNDFSKSTEKRWIPPYFREYWDYTSLNMYDRLWGSTEISDKQFAEVINSGVSKTKRLQDKIERTYEKQRADILETGIMTMNQGVGQINFKRKAASLVSSAGDYFVGNANPFAPFQRGAYFLRTVGKAYGGTFNAILGEEAQVALFANAAFLARQNYFNMQLDNIQAPQRNSEGAAFLGQITAGTYRVNLWAYPEVYQDSTGTFVPYMDPKKVVMIPENPDFRMVYAAVPQLLTPGETIKTGAYIFTDYIDEKARTHEFHVESAGIPVPVAIDQIYTFRAVAP